MRRLRPIVLLLLCAVATGCTSLLFYPTYDHVITPDVIGLTYREVAFSAADGTRLDGWFLPAVGPARGTIVFVHGNAENISTHIASVAWLPGAGFNVFLFDYRGFGSSEGKPTLDGLHLDTEAAFTEVFTLEGVDPKRVAVFGQSIGGSIAISALARWPRREQMRAVIVEGAFSSYRRIAQEKLSEFWPTWALQIPLSYTINDDYHPEDDIGDISPTPVLIIHGAADRIVSPSHAQDLYVAAMPPKALWVVPGASHIQALQGTAKRTRFVEYLDDCAFAGPPGGRVPEACTAAP